MSIPARGNEYAIIKYGLKHVQSGREWLKDQDGYGLIQPCLDRIKSKKQIEIIAQIDRAPDLATTSSNRFKKVFFELVAGMTDTKPFWEIKSMNPRFTKQAEVFSKLSSHWYTSTHADQDGLANALKWAVVAGTGYVHLAFDPREDRKNIYASAPDPRDVIPIAPPSKGATTSLQDCLAVCVVENRTVAFARELWPDHEYKILPDRGADENKSEPNTRAGRIYAQLNAKMRSPILDAMLGDAPNTTMGKQPTVDIFTLYIKDFSKNETSSPVEMGEFETDPTWQPTGLLDKMFGEAPRTPANNWSYLVQPGDRLYPRGRMIVFTRTCVLYDGPSMYWHGKFPIVKLTLDPLPDTWLGSGAMWDLLSLQDSLDWNMRVIDDHNAQVAQPGIIADQMSVDRQTLKRMNTRKGGWKLLTNMPSTAIQVVTPPPLDNSIKDHIDRIEREMEELAGLLDLKSLNNIGQIPASETVEKMIESKSLLLQGRSRVIEAFMSEFAHMMLFNFAQFYTQKMIFTVLGPDSQTPEMFDFDPGAMVPDFIHNDDFDLDGNLKLEALQRGPYPRYDRAKTLIQQLAYYVAPGSLLSGSAITKKLLYLQLRQEGLIDMWTLAQILDIPGFGEAPPGADTIPKRLMEEAALKMMMQMAAAPPMPPDMGGGMGGPPGGQAGPGHPQTNQEMPHFANNGEETVVSTA
jgi:hypothetical protein